MMNLFIELIGMSMQATIVIGAMVAVAFLTKDNTVKEPIEENSGNYYFVSNRKIQ